MSLGTRHFPLKKTYLGNAANSSLALVHSGRLPVMQEVRREAERHKIKLLVLPTIEAIGMLNQNPKDTNAILHVTC